MTPKPCKPALRTLKRYRGQLAGRPTAAELQFCRRLTGGRIHFLFQHLIPPYIVDFFIPKRMLIIELDGDHHYQPKQLAHDERRRRYLENKGFRIIRIRNADAKTWPLKTIRKYPKCKGAGRQVISKLYASFDTKGMGREATQGTSREVEGTPF